MDVWFFIRLKNMAMKMACECVHVSEHVLSMLSIWCCYRIHTHTHTHTHTLFWRPFSKWTWV